MSRLERILRELLVQGPVRALLIDDVLDVDAVHDETFYEHVQNEARIESFPQSWDRRQPHIQSPHGVSVRDISHDRAVSPREAARIRVANYNLILARPESYPIVDIVKNVIRSYAIVQALLRYHKAQGLVFVPSQTVNGLPNVVSLLSGRDASMLEPLDTEEFPTLMHYLCNELWGFMDASRYRRQKLDSEAHRYKNEVWNNDYLPYIDESLRGHNKQSLEDNYFLILSNPVVEKLRNHAPSAREKVKAKRPMTAGEFLEQEDLEKLSAIFIDNEWNNHPTHLGEGMRTLKEVRSALDRAGVTIPIIYQTAHELDDAEIEQISEFGAIATGKNIFPKVCAGPASKKEMMASLLAREDSMLAPHVAEIRAIGEGDKYHVVLSKLVDDTCKDAVQSVFFDKWEMEANVYNHRMYVLAQWHRVMSKHKDNPVFVPTLPRFFAWDELQASLGNRVAHYEAMYRSIAENPAHHEARTLSHNDAKDDNWFKLCVLGDYGNIAPGPEYKDVARALECEADNNHVLKDTEKAGKYVRNYMLIRTFIEPGVVLENFEQHVYEAIFTENVRLAYWYQRFDDDEKVQQHLEIAELWFNYLEAQVADPSSAQPCHTAPAVVEDNSV